MAISGQGCAGTRKLRISKSGDRWTVAEQWFQPRLQFFYTNWIQLDDQTILGCADQFLTALDISNGKVIGKWRGFADGNIFRTKDRLAVLSGRGKMVVLKLLGEGQGLIAEREYQLVEDRCWTPTTIIGERLYVRCGDKLICFLVSG